MAVVPMNEITTRETKIEEYENEKKKKTENMYENENEVNRKKNIIRNCYILAE